MTDSWGVATPHRTASDAAAEVLARGGNAVDAALAAATVLTVVYPNQCSVGGDVVALVGTPRGRVFAVDGSGHTARAADPERLARAAPEMPVYGPHAVTVPGAVAAWSEMARRWGTMPLASALRRAAELAADGVAVAAGLARDLHREAARLRADPGLCGVFLPQGDLLVEGDTLVQPRLARTLRRIADAGPGDFYAGAVAEGIVQTLRARGAPMALADFADHRTTLREPVVHGYAGVEYLTAPPGSQGVFFLQGMAALDVVRGRLGRELDPLGEDAGTVALVLDAAARDRDALLGDPQQVGLDARALLGSRARAIADEALAGRPGAPTVARVKPSGDTVAVVTADDRGGWVSLMQSNFHAFGSGILDPGSGVVLHNRGASFTLRSGSPNRLGPGRRPAHTLMPVLVRSGSALVGAQGTMGGRAQPQIHTQIALHLARGVAPQTSVALPRWVLEPRAAEAGDGRTTVAVEEGVPEAAWRSLARDFEVRPLAARDDEAGHAQLVRRWSGRVRSATDPRADGAGRVGGPSVE